MREFEILMVEDNPSDVHLTRAAFSAARLPVQIVAVDDGEKGIAYLRKERPYASVRQPDMILLDLNLPRMNGLEVLEAVKGDARLQHIPVLVFTSSSAPKDIFQAYHLHANSYMTKPSDMDDFENLIRAVTGFWLSAAELPSLTR